MANTKTYVVIKEGKELKELKTLAAAKKIADAEGAEVFCEGAVVYTATAPCEAEAEPVADAAVEPTVAEEPTVEEPHFEKYTLTAKMNVRTAPSLDAAKLAVAQAGTVVDVAAIEGDWLHLTDGTFILYADGKFAEKV